MKRMFFSKSSSSLYLLPTAGVVTSPNYPDNYPNNLERTYTIQVGEGLIISLQFTAFQIVAQYDYVYDYETYEYIYDYESVVGCYDHLTITDGDGTTLMDKSCGSSLPAAITSISNTVKIMFSTDGYRTESGWSLNWTAVTAGVFLPF